MNIMHIRCFWEVVKTHNFTEAAERLYLTQSTVSKNISALEKELGFLLFERRGRTMLLTTEGQKLLKNFAEIISAYEKAEEAVEVIRKSSHLPGGRVRMSMVPVVERLGIISKLNRYAANNPGFKPAIEIMDESQVILSLQSGGCDVAFCSNLKLDSRLYDMRKYSTHKFSLVVSKDCDRSWGDALRLKDLEREKLIFLHPDSMLWGLCVRACETAGFYPTIALTTSRPDIALEYVGSSDCIYMAIDLETKDCPAEIYKVIELLDSPEFDYVFAWRRADGLTAAAREYIEHMTGSETIPILNV